MKPPTSETLRSSKCLPCEGGVPTIGIDAAKDYLAATPQWKLDDAGRAIFRKWKCDHFVAAIDLIQRIASVAEQEQHHPDLHLTGYRHLRVELTTHAIGGLSENDFIVAAKIDQLLP